MKKYLAVFIGLMCSALAGTAQADPPGCAKFRTGTFAYRNDSANAVLIKRTGNFQEETVKKTGVVTRLRVRWLSACSYEIKQVWSNSKKQRKNNGSVTVVMITKAGQDEYEFTCECKDRMGPGGKPGIMYRVP